MTQARVTSAPKLTECAPWTQLAVSLIPYWSRVKLAGSVWVMLKYPETDNDSIILSPGGWYILTPKSAGSMLPDAGPRFETSRATLKRKSFRNVGEKVWVSPSMKL